MIYFSPSTSLEPILSNQISSHNLYRIVGLGRNLNAHEEENMREGIVESQKMESE